MNLYLLTAFKVHSPGHADYCYKESGQLLESAACLQSYLLALGEVNASHSMNMRQQGWIKCGHLAAATKKRHQPASSLLLRLLL